MRKGFTLIELMVVISIIGVLTSVTMIVTKTARIKANDAQRVSSLREVQQALIQYAADHNDAYPTTNSTWHSECAAWGSYSQANVIPGLSPKYIGVIPRDPQMNKPANTCCFLYFSDAVDYKFMDYNCPTANTTNKTLEALKDGNYKQWSVYSSLHASNDW